MAYPLINVRFIMLTSASFIAIFSSIAIYFCLPILISHMIRTQITLSPSSGSFHQWRLNSVIDRIYLYNITNLSDLPSESAAASQASRTPGSRRPVPRLQQVGPFTFRQDREKVNIKFELHNETVLYDQKRTWSFLPELSVMKSPDEMRTANINHVSVPLAGTTMNPEFGELIEPIVSEFGLRLFLNHSAQALLFEGYPDLLMEQAKASGQIDVDRFGWMHNQNNTLQRAIRVFTGGPSNATLSKFGQVDEFEQRREFTVWHNNNTEPGAANSASDVKCNQFRLSSPGEFFPPPEYSLIGHNNYYQYTQHQQRQAELMAALEGAAHQQGPLEQQQQLQQAPRDLNKRRSESETANKRAPAPATVHHSHQQQQQQQQQSAAWPTLRLDPTKEGKSISLFMPELCRTIKLSYAGSYDFKDLLLVDRYLAGHETFMYSSNQPQAGGAPPPQSANSKSDTTTTSSLAKSNTCFCNYNETSQQTSCPPNGMMDLFNCRKGSPVGISFPHFLYSRHDPSLEPYLKLYDDDEHANKQDQVEPLDEELAEHGLFVDLESSLNVPVNVQIVLQFNVRLRLDRSMNWTEEYAYLTDGQVDGNGQPLRDFYLPQMWIKSTAGVDETNLAHLRFIQRHLQLVTPITTIIIFGFASVLLLASAKLAYDLAYGPHATGRKLSRASGGGAAGDHESCSSLGAGAHACALDQEELEEMRRLKRKKKLQQQQKQMADLATVGAASEKSPFTKFASSMGNLAPGPSSTQLINSNHNSNYPLASPLEELALARQTSGSKQLRAHSSFVIPSVGVETSHPDLEAHDSESAPLNR